MLVNVTGGLDMTLLEVDEAANAISDQVDPDANIIFGAAFDPALDGKIRVSVVATGMDDEATQSIEPPQQRPLETPRAPAMPTAATSYAAATRHEPMTAREPAAAVLGPRTGPAGRPGPGASAQGRGRPVIRPAQPAAASADPERVIGRIVDPSVEEYEDEAAEVEQGDLYFDRRPEPAPARRPAPNRRRRAGAVRRRQPVREPASPRRGWSLFGRGRRSPTSQSYQQDAPAPSCAPDASDPVRPSRWTSPSRPRPTTISRSRPSCAASPTRCSCNRSRSLVRLQGFRRRADRNNPKPGFHLPLLRQPSLTA